MVVERAITRVAKEVFMVTERESEAEKLETATAAREQAVAAREQVVGP